MAIFDSVIKEINTYVRKMAKAGREVREFYCSDIIHQVHPKIGPGACSGIIMKSDTFLELGGPSAGSCAFAIYSKNSSLIQNERIRLIGPDVHESPSSTIAFGQIIIAGGKNIDDKDYLQLIESQYTGDQIEGYMVKSMPGHIWSRISNEVVIKKGFDFRFLGMALMEIIKTHVLHIDAIEIIFVTSGKMDLQDLQKIEVYVSKIVQNIKNKQWGKRGINISDCVFGGNCTSCVDKNSCYEIKKLIRDKNREAKFKQQLKIY